MSQFLQFEHGDLRDVFVHAYLHLACDPLNWSDLFFRKRSRIFEAGIDILTLYVRISAKKPFDGIAVCQHANYLMNGNTRALYASLSVVLLESIEIRSNILTLLPPEV